jgi:hypothetical protein
MSSIIGSSHGIVVMRRSPRWQPDGDVDVDSRHRLKPQLISSFVMCDSIVGRLGWFAMYLSIFSTFGLSDRRSSGIKTLQQFF